MRHQKTIISLFIILSLLFTLSALNLKAGDNDDDTKKKKTLPKTNKGTQIAFLGTGNPNPDPQHSGISVAIIVNDTPYIVDCGVGLVRRAAALTPRYGGKIPALTVKNIKHVFITHLHSDHTLGYADLILTPWVMGRRHPLEVYAPKGIAHMTKHILEAYKEDIEIRAHGVEPTEDKGWRVNTHDIKEGVIFQDKNVKVEAFRVKHGNWKESYGFKFTTPDRVIGISGDCMPDKNLVEKCKGVDVLIHEVYSYEGFLTRKKSWQKYHTVSHTSTHELAKIANEVKPGLLLLYHQLYWGVNDKQLVKEITDRYNGKVISARDLDVY